MTCDLLVSHIRSKKLVGVGAYSRGKVLISIFFGVGTFSRVGGTYLNWALIRIFTVHVG